MKIWRFTLAGFLGIYGLLAVTNIQFQFSGFVLGALAIATAVLILFDR